MACMEIEDEKAGEFFSIDGLLSSGPKSIRKMNIELGNQVNKPRESLAHMKESSLRYHQHQTNRSNNQEEKLLTSRDQGKKVKRIATEFEARYQISTSNGVDLMESPSSNDSQHIYLISDPSAQERFDGSYQPYYEMQSPYSAQYHSDYGKQPKLDILKKKAANLA